MEVYQTHNITGAQVLREAHELGQIDQWVAWRWGRPKDNGKRPKLPINPHTGDRADTTDARTWASITQATTAVEKYSCTGIGFVFTREDDFAGVDLDGCVENGEVAPWGMEIVEALASYTELSPSRTGLKIWVKASKPGDRCKNKTGDIEIYDSGRFFTFTGERFAGSEVEERQEAVSALYHKTFPTTTPLESPSQARRMEPRSSQSNLNDHDVLDKARTSQYGSKFEALFDFGTDGDHSKGDYELLKILAFWCGKDAEQMERLFSQSALGQRDKWTRRKDYRQRTINKAIEATTKTYDPEYGKPKETTRESLQRRMEYALAEHQWREKAGRTDAASTDYFGYRAILTMAYRANKTTIGISLREYAEAAGIGSLRTANDSLRRLEDKHSLFVKGADDKETRSAVYSLKTVLPKRYHSLIRKEVVSSFLINNTTVAISETVTVLGSTPEIRNQAPDLPDFDKNGRRLPQGKQDPLKRLGKPCGWILDLVVASRGAVSKSFLSERTGVAENHLVERYINKMIVAGLLKATDEGFVSTANAGEALGEELELSGCNDAARRQRERHEREREAYRTRKERPVDKEPIREVVMMEEVEEIEEFPEPTKPVPSLLALVLHDYLERHPQAADETPSWIANTLWAYDLYPGKPTAREVAAALEELGGNRSLIKFA